jgi:hypothetical protein
VEQTNSCIESGEDTHAICRDRDREREREREVDVLTLPDPKRPVASRAARPADLGERERERWT